MNVGVPLIEDEGVFRPAFGSKDTTQSQTLSKVKRYSTYNATDSRLGISVDAANERNDRRFETLCPFQPKVNEFEPQKMPWVSMYLEDDVFERLSKPLSERVSGFGRHPRAVAAST